MCDRPSSRAPALKGGPWGPLLYELEGVIVVDGDACAGGLWRPLPVGYASAWLMRGARRPGLPSGWQGVSTNCESVTHFLVALTAFAAINVT